MNTQCASLHSPGAGQAGEIRAGPSRQPRIVCLLLGKHPAGVPKPSLGQDAVRGIPALRGEVTVYQAPDPRADQDRETDQDDRQDPAENIEAENDRTAGSISVNYRSEAGYENGQDHPDGRILSCDHLDRRRPISRRWSLILRGPLGLCALVLHGCALLLRRPARRRCCLGL